MEGRECPRTTQRRCAFCNCGEGTQLGQGELTCYEPTSTFNVFRKTVKRPPAPVLPVEEDLAMAQTAESSTTDRRTRSATRAAAAAAAGYIF